MDIQETKKTINVTIGLMLGILIASVVATWWISRVYFNHELDQREMLELEEKIEYVDKRHDRKYTRLLEMIEEMQEDE